MKTRKTISLIILLVSSISIKAQEPFEDFKRIYDSIGKSELLILGTFHFRDAGLDSFKSKNQIDIMSAEKQKELEIVLRTIESFKPTKIAVEYPKEYQGKLDSLYNEYLAGKLKLPVNEVYQVGFKLANRLGHSRVYAIDVKGRSFYSDISDKEFEKKEKELWALKTGSLKERAKSIDSLYYNLYHQESRLKKLNPLIEYYLKVNEEERNKLGHGIYLNGNFRIGVNNDYFGPDSVTRWYNRNVRMFHNLANINNIGDDRIFLVVGKGHLSLLNFLADASLDFKRVIFSNLVKQYSEN